MFRYLSILLIAVVLVAPVISQEESPTIAFNLDGSFNVTDLGIQFLYPSDWVYAVSDGIFFAQTQEDLDRLLDDDVESSTSNVFFSVTAFPLDFLGFDADADLEDIADTIVDIAEIDEGDRFSLGIMARPSISIVGQNPLGRYGILTAFIRGDLLVIFSIGSPELPLLEEAYTFWGALLSSITPIDRLELEPTPYLWEEFGFRIAYPLDWIVVPEEQTILQLERDTIIFDEPDTPIQGYIVFIAQLPVENVGLGENPPIEQVSQAVRAIFADALEFRDDDYVIDFRSAFGIETIRENGSVTYLAGFIVQDNLNLILMGAPNRAQATEIYDTWLAMLASIRVVQIADN